MVVAHESFWCGLIALRAEASQSKDLNRKWERLKGQQFDFYGTSAAGEFFGKYFGMHLAPDSLMIRCNDDGIPARDENKS